MVPVYISLFVLVPFIFTGIALFSFLAAYQGGHFLPEGYLPWLGLAVIIFAALSGIAITSAILNPLRRFVDSLRQLPAFTREQVEPPEKSVPRSEMGRFDHMFREVANLISKVDAGERFPSVVGQSRAIRNVLSQIVKVAPTDTTVLILGESGVGKELVASAIHRESPRRDMPLIKLNCVAIPEGLLESELFGHEKGSFTGAVARKTGKFELAHGGTLFLDEIGDMPMETQGKLLRVLQERQIERVGGTRTIDVDVRFIAASNKNLPRMAEKGLFRDDLLYRLNVFSIIVPPLRERLEDIPLLCRHLLKDAPGTPELTSEAMRELMNHDWPGNVRELANALARNAVMAEGGIIRATDLRENRNGRIDLAPLPRSGVKTLPEQDEKEEALHEKAFDLDRELALFEREMIENALIRSGGVQVAAARLLGINQRSLWHRVKKHAIDVEALKKQASGK